MFYFSFFQPPTSLAPSLPTAFTHHVTFLCSSSDVTFVNDVITQLAQPSFGFTSQKLEISNDDSSELRCFGREVLPAGVRPLCLIMVMSRCLIANVSRDVNATSVDLALSRATEALQPRSVVILRLDDTCQLPAPLHGLPVVCVTSPNWWTSLVSHLCSNGILRQRTCI